MEKEGGRWGGGGMFLTQRPYKQQTHSYRLFFFFFSKPLQLHIRLSWNHFHEASFPMRQGCLSKRTTLLVHREVGDIALVTPQL